MRVFDDRSILMDILSRNSPAQFKQAVDSYNLHPLYENYANYLRATYFEGNNRRLHIFMSRLFGSYLSSADSVEGQQLSQDLRDLTATIKRAKRYGIVKPESIQRQSQMVSRMNELKSSLKPLIREYNKIQKKKNRTL